MSLEAEFEEYEFDFYDTSKRRHFRLNFQRATQRSKTDRAIPCWSTTFREVTKNSKFGGSTVGFDLLSPGGPGVGHYFPREDWAGIFCPIERPGVLDGPIYPLRAERTFEIENFRLSIRATDYQYDKKENTFKKLELTIRLKNK